MISNGNPERLNRFLAGMERRAFKMAHIATNDRDEALDIVQEAMIKLANAYGDRSEDDWTPLFYRILQNRIMDWHRRRKIWQFVRVFTGDYSKEENDPALNEALNFTANDPGTNLQHQKAAKTLESELQKLPLRQQQAFLLRAWEGLDVKQTARAMGCSEGSVKTHYSRAVHTLRERLEDHWP